ncbi:hypothetical protein CTI12_AA180780 [Artemisia annua]|uniref:Chromo domain-containing protein n=1 Tax=Artemisia annua TaxID=35608 RepID=A0A2U1P8T3_ARTAN|nr:hypothetical protein CTI12_AA180780 [Artemisia annua]
MLAISYPTATWLDDIRTYFATDPKSREFAASNLTAFDPKDDLAFLPEAILDLRTDSNGDPEVLIKWEKHSFEEATWENLTSLRLQFPDLDYIGDNVNSDGEGDDTTQHDQSPSPQHQATQIQTRPVREVKKTMRYRD